MTPEIDDRIKELNEKIESAKAEIKRLSLEIKTLKQGTKSFRPHIGTRSYKIMVVMESLKRPATLKEIQEEVMNMFPGTYNRFEERSKIKAGVYQLSLKGVISRPTEKYNRQHYYEIIKR